MRKNTDNIIKYNLSRDVDPVLAKKTGSGALYLKRRDIFCYHFFYVRRCIDILDSENQPGSGF